MTRRVAITGIGIVSSIGNNAEEVRGALYEGHSGISHRPDYAAMGFRSHLAGSIDIDIESAIDRKLRRFMGDGVAYNYIAMAEAIADAGLGESSISTPRTGLVMGSGGTSTANVVQAADVTRDKGPRRMGPYMVTRTMSSSHSACLATAFRIKGINYSISSACATSAHCIGHGAELIQLGKQDIVFAGGGEEVHWSLTSLFDAMGALSSSYNDRPEAASRPYDVERDGFVIAGGGGVLVLEELEHARARGARVYAELVGYGATSDGHDMVAPSGDGAIRCMQQALTGVEAPVDYVNAHGTSTPAGDMVELEAMRRVFGDELPATASTKSLTGHALGGAGVHEAIYSLLMMQGGFISASANIEQLDPQAEGFPIVRERTEREINTLMSNSFGFGGTNASIVFARC
ncbi:MAG: beta-ketoacyl-ACP synthase I [Pseudomonadales bacterium]|nr:beta-ketoacyl-ACP synthase I [Pseudomonadales bacterium]